jgi:hypothetical protein
MREKITKKKRREKEFDQPYFNHKKNNLNVNGFVLENRVH